MKIINCLYIYITWFEYIGISMKSIDTLYSKNIFMFLNKDRNIFLDNV